VAVLAAAALSVAELPFAAFMADDLIHLGRLEGVLPCRRLCPLELYTLSDGVPEHVRAMQDAGALPWFFGAEFKMAFLRPLTSASLAVDHALWGLWPIGYRLQSAAWFIVLVAGLGSVLRRVLPGRAPYGHRVTRTAADTLELELVDGEIEAPNLDVGDVVALDGMRANVLARGDGGTAVRRGYNSGSIDRSLDAATLQFLTWRQGRLRRVVLPAIGREIVL